MMRLVIPFFLLSATAGQFFLPSDQGTPITQITIANGDSTFRVDYRATLANPTPFNLFAFTSDGLSPTLFGLTASVNWKFETARLDVPSLTVLAWP